jgi:hypothetical protein
MITDQEIAARVPSAEFIGSFEVGVTMISESKKQTVRVTAVFVLMAVLALVLLYDSGFTGLSLLLD